MPTFSSLPARSVSSVDFWSLCSHNNVGPFPRTHASSSSLPKVFPSPHRTCYSSESQTTWGQEVRAHLKNLDLDLTMNFTSCTLSWAP